MIAISHSVFKITVNFVRRQLGAAARARQERVDLLAQLGPVVWVLPACQRAAHRVTNLGLDIDWAIAEKEIFNRDRVRLDRLTRAVADDRHWARARRRGGAWGKWRITSSLCGSG